MMIKTKLKKIASLLSITLCMVTLSACQKQSPEQQKAAEELKASQSKAASYSSYVSTEAKLPAVSMSDFISIYQTLHDENNGIVHNQDTGSYSDFESSVKTLQARVNDKDAPTQDVKNAYSNAKDKLSQVKKGAESNISKMEQYRDNSILKQVAKYYQMEVTLCKLNKQYIKSIYEQDSNANNSASIELYKVHIGTLYNKIEAKMTPIIQQYNYEQASIQHSNATESNKQSSQDSALNPSTDNDDSNSISKSGSDEIQRNNKGTAQNNLDKYNAQLPSDK